MQQILESGTHTRWVMPPADAGTSGTFRIGGDMVVSRLGFARYV